MPSAVCEKCGDELVSIIGFTQCLGCGDTQPLPEKYAARSLDIDAIYKTEPVGDEEDQEGTVD
jgi:hypothetical protein